MTLVVFFSRGVSLDSWRRAGILERELALYRRLSVDFDRLALVTYGDRDDGRHATNMAGLDVLSNPWRLPGNLYSILAPLLHWRYLRTATVLRTNQINGAWCAVLARALHRKPLVVRCGFLWADNVERITLNRWRRRISRALERLAFRSADRVVVASSSHAATVVSRYGVPVDRVTVIPNYVDTSLFCPSATTTREPGRILCVGRLEAEKNLAALIDAMSHVPGARLTLVGDGSLRESLHLRARAAGADVEFLGRVAHAELPALMHKAELFVLPSHYEGHPKALVEAMACGVPVIGTRVPGIQDVIVDRENGVLCGTSAPEIGSALTALMRDAPLRERLAAEALAYARAECSLDVAVQRERAVIASLPLAV